ncbi:unnamed protein product [Adineta steineri]|uniref:NAD(P)(+)--arginine ADP-ribosyltransferase n=1 Tax=Adineta steineri TaxID=433720 RepID=A0A814NQ88_9BILA|nr:unnamed protein product [Adineta steineri]CAF3511604.1 unnamed protein product [Adineta steineri]
MNKISESGFDQKTSVSSNPIMNNSNTTIKPSDVIPPWLHMVQNYSILWLEECIDQTNKDHENNLIQIRTIVDNVNVFKQRDECIDFLSDAQDIKSFLIIENSMVQQIMPLINDIPQLDSIYILSNIKSLHEELTQKWQKIKSVHTNIDDLCQELQVDVKQYKQDSISMSFVPVKEMALTDNLNQLEPTFMYTQIFKDILLDMEHGKQAIKQFTAYCRHNDCLSPIYIDRFEKEYQDKLSIWWYTFPSNIFSMLNYGLRTMNADIIITMGFFLRDVHKHIQQLYEQQINAYGKKPFLVYRGQGFVKSDFEKLQQTEGGLMSFNNFLSTSKDKEVSIGYARIASTEPDKVGILFIMSINPCIKSTPFASIKEESYFKEEDEILFSMHTVFRVGAIKQMDNENQLYQVELQLTSDDDQQLRLLTDRIREEADGSTGWQRLGKLLYRIGQFNKAEELYNVLLEERSNDGGKVLYYNQLGAINIEQGNYEKALWYYEQALQIFQKYLPLNHPYLSATYNNIGNVYKNMGEYSKALLYYEKAVEICQKNYPSNHPDLAATYNNIGNVYNLMGEYSKALSFYQKTLEISQKTLPSNHPHLTQSYTNIGMLYSKMEEYLKALSFFEKAFEIQQKTLPPNHPLLATSYNNIGGIYNQMGECLKALSSHEKALKIRKNALPSNHPDLAQSYNNIGSVHNQMGECSKALSSYEKALEIQQKTLPSNHPSLAISYNNIGFAYQDMKDHSKALSYFERALDIFQRALPPTHPHLVTSYNNIGIMYDNMGEYSKALSFYEKVLEIREQTLPLNHPDLATSYDNIRNVYSHMYSKALEIREQTLPLNNSSLATSYNNISLLYDHMGDYSKALSFYQKELEIEQKTLPSTHPSLAASYNNIGLVYDSMEEYSKALLFYEKALEIEQKTFPSNHPSLATSYNNIGWVYRFMKDYLKALSYYEGALDILKHTLPPNHPSIKDVQKSIKIVKSKL